MNKPRFILTEYGYYKNIDFKKPILYQGYNLKRNKLDIEFYRKRKDILRRDLQKNLLPIILRLKKKFRGSLKVLDIGCGDGVILESLHDIACLQKIKIELYGIDPDSLAFKKVRVPANLVKGVSEKMPFADNFFHLVVSSQTIEHLTEKQVFKTNKEVYRTLKRGGLYYIETPNPKSVLTKAMKEHWWMYLPDHMMLYPPKTLALILNSVGFRNIMIKSRYEKDEQINEIREAFIRLFPEIKNIYIARVGMFLLKIYIIFFSKGAVTTVLVEK